MFIQSNDSKVFSWQYCVAGKFSETLGGAMGECRIVTWFWPLISILVSSKQIFASSSKRPADHQHGFLVRSSACFFLQILSVVGTICCSCLCCAFCPLYHLGKCLRPNENVWNISLFFTFVFFFVKFLVHFCLENSFAPSAHSRPADAWRQMRLLKIFPFFISFVILVEHFFVKYNCSFFWKYLSKIKEFEILQFYLCFFSVNLSPDSTTLA